MEEIVAGEILEDIECLNPEESYENEDDMLNFDTFGDFTSTYQLKQNSSQGEFFDNLRFGGFEMHDLPNLNKIHLNDNYSRFLNFINNIETTTDNRVNRMPKELDFHPFTPKPEFMPKPKEERKIISPLIRERRPQYHRHPNPNKPNHAKEHHKSKSSFKEDIKLMRKMGLFPIDCCKQVGKQLRFKVPKLWHTAEDVNERHRNARAPSGDEKQLYMTSVEFDNILRIQLSQVSKNPKLQNYSGRWNFKHMMNQIQNKEREPTNKNDQAENHVDDLDTSTGTNADENKKIKLFGRSSVTCIRHGRKQIYLENSENFANDNTQPLKRAKWAIEDCYEQYFIILELIKTIKSGIGSVEKMKEDRDQKLVVLYETLTQANIEHTDPIHVDRVFEEILNLEKGRKMIFRISKLFKSKFKNRLILEIFKTGILHPILTRDRHKKLEFADYELELIQFVCVSISQVTAKRYPEFIVPFLNLKIAKNLMRNIRTTHGVEFVSILSNKLLDSLREGHLDILTCKKFTRFIAKVECLAEINKRVTNYIE